MGLAGCCMSVPHDVIHSRERASSTMDFGCRGLHVSDGVRDSIMQNWPSSVVYNSESRTNSLGIPGNGGYFSPARSMARQDSASISLSVCWSVARDTRHSCIYHCSLRFLSFYDNFS